MNTMLILIMTYGVSVSFETKMVSDIGECQKIGTEFTKAMNQKSYSSTLNEIKGHYVCSRN